MSSNSPKKLKIFHIIDSGGLYGAEIMLLHLVSEQMREGLDPVIASIGEKGIKEKPLETEAIRSNFRVEKFRMTPGPNYLGAYRILTLAWKDGATILHSHGYKGNILLGLIPKRIRKIPIVTTVHGYTSTGNGYSRMRFYEWLDTRALGFMDAVVFVSNAMKADSRFKNIRSSKVHVIHNGIAFEPERLQQAQMAQDLDPKIVDFCRSGFIIGSIGRLSREKGFDVEIEALEILVEKGIDARLVIIGEGDQREELEQLAIANGISDRVLLTGYRQNARDYMKFFNVFVLSSFTEGLPITMLEAMQAKVAVVASDVGGIAESLHNGEAGILVKPGRPEELARGIERLYGDAELAKKLRRTANELVTEQFNSQAMAQEYHRLYRVITQGISQVNS